LERVGLSYLKVAEKAAREAGKVLIDHLGKVKEVEYKAKNSLLTEVDKLSEGLIIEIIKSNFPSHDFFAEESGRDKKTSSHVWIIDPLDGTTNYAHTYPVFSVSIALEIEGVIRLGIVYDPMRDEFFNAEFGNGAYLNWDKIKISETRVVAESLLCTGFTHEKEWMVDENLKHFENFIRRARAIRRDGSAALDLCYVACGRYDGFWELGLHAWDTAAGFLILKEAGGHVSDFSNSEFTVFGEEILATNGLIHDEMIGILSLGRGQRT
jgi:myo-inositol-1(or 4)-monophosphatase